MRQNQRHKTSGPANPHAFAHGFRPQPGHLSCARELHAMEHKTKKCPKCGQRKAMLGFYRNATKTDGYSSLCKECERHYRRTHHEATRDQANAQKAVYRALHRTELARQSSEYYQAHSKEREAWRQQYNAKHPDRLRAACVVRCAIRAGVLPLRPCEICSSELNVQRHHTDYAKPLMVTYLCYRCHRRVHTCVRDLALLAEKPCVEKVR